MSDFKEGDVTIDGVKIHYYRSGGKKPPIVMLHGVSDTGLCWTRAANALSDKYDVIMVDAQGHGLSDRAGKNFTFEHHTSQTAFLIKALGLKKPVVMGHSMGAGTAASVAADYPDIPGAVILEDPPWSETAPHPRNPDEAKTMQQDFRTMFTDLKKRRVQDIIIEGKKMNPLWTEEELLPWAASKKQFDLDIFNSVVISPHPFEETVVKIQCPTLLITAENGGVSQETAEKIAGIWKAKAPYRWVRIKGAGHNIRRENFTAYMEAVEKFLEETG
jgi:N-formylmaleamate deformylase